MTVDIMHLLSFCQETEVIEHIKPSRPSLFLIFTIVAYRL